MTISKGVIDHMKTLYKEEWEDLKGLSKDDLIASVIVARYEAKMLITSLSELENQSQNNRASYMWGRKSIGGVTV